MRNIGFNSLHLLFILVFIIPFASCNTEHKKKLLVFENYPDMKIGLSTQDFQKSIPFNVEGINEIIEYSAREGYHFIELRDVNADLSSEDCRTISELAKKNNINVIYVIGVNLLDPRFRQVFQKGLSNTLFFPDPGILRTILSKSEFDGDSSKKGWNESEFNKIKRISDSCAAVAESKGIQFLVENTIEAFFGDSLSYYGIADFLTHTSGTGFQIDIGNLFRNNTRVAIDPEKVMNFMPTIGDRWIETHLKTAIGGVWEPVLTENPITVKEIIDLMGNQNVNYAMLELIAVDDKQQCFDNHATSIEYLKNAGVLRK